MFVCEIIMAYLISFSQEFRIKNNLKNNIILTSGIYYSKMKEIDRRDGWLFAGADFSALEERIGAILSRDPNRIKVYTDGMDGHSMRAYRYFSDQMPDITAALSKAETATTFWINDKSV